MPFDVNIQNLATRIATEVKALRTMINGNVAGLTDLTTTDKSSLVGAINEVKASATGSPPAATETTAGVVELATAAETTTGTDATRAVHPAGLKVELDKKANTASLGYFATGTDASNLTGTLPTGVLPPLAVNEVYVVASQAAMLALTAQRGDVAIRTDNANTYILATDSPGTLADWKEVTASGDVTSVAGKTGAVTLVKGDVGLGNVDNTSDASKPVSTAQQAALDAKQDLDATLTALAGLTTVADRMIYATGANAFALSTLTAFARTLLDDADAATARTTLDVYSKAEVGNPATNYVTTFEAGLD